ncbi:MAG: hypothetical protein J1F42_05195 [Lachnospiraceae bacterium]|nr:hypothetical protein [Lachnospiraceae bacterium]
MKKRLISVWVTVFVLMITGCGKSNSVNRAEESNGTDSQITDNTNQTDVEQNEEKETESEQNEVIIENIIDTEDEPIWAMGTQVDGELYQNLNLDGVGDFDDEAYVSTYQFGDYEDKVTVISIHLGTGETVAQVFPVYGDYTLQTGRVFSEEKDAIILEIRNSTSNYGAATVFVLNVSPAKVYGPIPSAGTLLNTTEAVMLVDGEIIDTTSLPNLVTGGTKVVDIEGMPRQGVLIYSVGEEDEYQGLPRIFYWMANGWAIIPEESSENDDHTRINEGEIYAYIVGTDIDKISIVEVEMGWVPNFDPDLMGLHEGIYYSIKDALVEQLTLSTDCAIDVIPEPYDERKIVSAEEFTVYLQEQWKSPGLIPYTLTISDGEITEIMERYIP